MAQIQIGSITQVLHACFKRFDEFVEDTKGVANPQPQDLDIRAWLDEMGRLRMWAANIGAHRAGQSSLDFRLRDASHIRQQIIRLLEALLRRLQDGRNVLTENGDNRKGSSDDEMSGDEESEEELTLQTELDDLRESFGMLMNRLFQMSMLVRKPAQVDLHIRSKNIDVSAFEHFDLNHVREKFPEADQILVQRLGKANTRRRRYLMYRKRHAAKLRQGIENVGGDDNDQDATTESNALSDTLATNFREWDLDLGDSNSESGGSQTSYASTLMTGGSITIPAPPKESEDGAPFECPYCFFIIMIQSTSSWNAHVFRDLQPYSCTELACATPDRLFTTRREWLHHTKMVHPSSPLNEQYWLNTSESACYLCRQVINSKQSLVRHVARHLQELALFVLPRSDEESDASDNGPDSPPESSDESSNRSIDADADQDKSNDENEPSEPKSRGGATPLRNVSLKKVMENDEKGLLSEGEKRTLQNLQKKSRGSDES